MLNIASLIIGFIALIFAIIAFLPLLGILTVFLPDVEKHYVEFH